MDATEERTLCVRWIWDALNNPQAMVDQPEPESVHMDAAMWTLAMVLFDNMKHPGSYPDVPGEAMRRLRDSRAMEEIGQIRWPEVTIHRAEPELSAGQVGIRSAAVAGLAALLCFGVIFVLLAGIGVVAG